MWGGLGSEGLLWEAVEKPGLSPPQLTLTVQDVYTDHPTSRTGMTYMADGLADFAVSFKFFKLMCITDHAFGLLR